MEAEWDNKVFPLLRRYFQEHDVAYIQKWSYDHFLTHRLPKIIEEEPRIEINFRKNEFFHVEFGQVFVDRPYIVDEKRIIQYIMPNEAMLRDLTYSSVLSINIFTRHFIVEEDGSETLVEEKSYSKIPFARIPMMVGCSKCNLALLTEKDRIAKGNCPNDPGGYFIIKGKERVLVAQERTNYNMVYVFDKKMTDQKHVMVSEIRSMSEETGHSVLIQMKICALSLRIMVHMPFIAQEIPLGFVFVAYGCSIESIEQILRRNLNLHEEHRDADVLIQGVLKDARMIQNEEMAIQHIAHYATHVVSKERRHLYVKQILMNEVFPHLGITNNEMHKIMFLGHMCSKLIMTYIGRRPMDDRDHLANKRIEVSGILVGDLFRTLWKRFIRTIIPQLSKRLDILTIISKLNIITMGMRHCFSTGNWGIPKSNYIRAGVSQVLSRLSYNAMLSHLRRIVIPIGKEGRNTKIRQVHPTQIGFICSSETPEGSSAGIVKNFALASEVSMYFNPIVMRMILEKIPGIEFDFDCFLSRPVWNKVFLNGNWLAIAEDIPETIRYLEYFKYEQKSIPQHVSFNTNENEVHIFCDEGRMIRPFFSVKKMPAVFEDWDHLVREGNIVWLDSHELENRVIAMFPWEITPGTDLCEIHPCLMLGICASMMPFADHTQSPRICYHSSMVKQSIGIYSGTNEIRADTVAHILSYPERPIVRSHVEQWMRLDQLPCGNNVVVAIACYGGWNQEDSIILNKSSVDNGLFRSFTYKTIMVEEKKKTSSHFETIDLPPADMRIRSFNYSKLGANGIVRKGVFVGSGDVIVSKISIRQVKMGREEKIDTSIVIKNGEEGYVDKVFVTTTPEGYRMVKIKIRCLKIAEIGDKLCSNCAQKGTIGMILNKEDMPFTPDGIIPDIIINPLCFPADTWVQCGDGLSRKMGDLLDHPIRVETFSIRRRRLLHGMSMGGECKGRQKLVRLLREDGGIVRCTPDHRFLVCDRGAIHWKRADALSLMEDEMVMGAYTPHDEIHPDEISGWSFVWDEEETLSIDNHRHRLLMLFRLAGMCFHHDVISIKRKIDWRSVEDDLYCCDMSFQDFSRMDLFMTICRRDTPLVVVREFLAGYLAMHSDYGPGYWIIHGYDLTILHRLAVVIVDRFNIVCHFVEKDDRMWLKIEDVIALVHRIGIRYHRLHRLRMTVMAAYQARIDRIDFQEYLRRCRADAWFFLGDNDAPRQLFWTCRLRERIVEDALQDVYCIGVEKTHCFLAGSMVAENCIPSRMTINQLMESIGAKSAAINGRFRHATTFSSHSVNVVDRLKDELHRAGYEKNGNECMINGITGERMEADIFVGINYYHRLKHLVSAKIHARNHGKVSQLTQQPLEGRSRDGGLRFGEMERDTCAGSCDISLKCGVSIKLKTMLEGGWDVLGWDPIRKGVRPSRKIAFLDKGKKECVQITLQDGRTIVCTPDHPMLTSDLEWVRAQNLIVKASRLKVGLYYPCIDLEKEIEECQGWSFDSCGMDLRTDTMHDLLRSMAFMRILGWMVTDGGLYNVNGAIEGKVSLGHQLDVQGFLDDLGYFCSAEYCDSDPSRFMKTCCDNKSGKSWSYYSIRLPSYFIRSICQIKGITIGKKVCQEACLPAFVMADDFPRPLIREFLGGMFGGDGHTCILSMHRGKRDVLTSVSFSKSRTKPYVDSLVRMMEDLKILLARCDIHNVTIQNLKETSHSKQKSADDIDKCYQSTLHLDMSELIPFWEKIGFRHCAHKSLRLEAGVSYKRLRDIVIRQHNWLVQRVDEITGFSDIKKTFPNKIVGTKKAIKQAVDELSQRETLIHPYAIPTTHDITDHLIKGTSFGKFTSKSFPNAEEFMKDIGAYHWFVENEDSKNIRGHTCYAIKTEDDVLPTMDMTVIGIRPCGPEEVYDIEVEETNSFLANGIVAHNCMISHGNSRFLLERLFDMSDPFKIPVCQGCGNMPSSMTQCSVCEGTGIVTVPMPYACKLLFQELNAMGIRINFFPEQD